MRVKKYAVKTLIAERTQSSQRSNAIVCCEKLIRTLKSIPVFNQGDVEAQHDAINDIKTAMRCIVDINGVEDE